MYEGPLGLPFIFETSANITNMTLRDHEGRLNIDVLESLVQPGRSVTMIKVEENNRCEIDQLVPNAVLDFDYSSNGDNGLGLVGFPPKGNMPMEAYLKKAPASNGILCRKFHASDGQDYQWSLVSGGPRQPVQWTCSTLSTNYLVATYEDSDNGKRYLTVVDSWVYLIVELLTSLTIARQIAQRDLNYS